MRFNWLKKKAAKPGETAPNSYKVRVLLPDPPETAAVTGQTSQEAVRPEPHLHTDILEQHEPYRIPELPSVPARCGFTTCDHGDAPGHEQGMTPDAAAAQREEELFRQKVLIAENLEECLRIIAEHMTGQAREKEADEPDEPAETPVQEPKMAENSDYFSLWGNRISG